MHQRQGKTKTKKSDLGLASDPRLYRRPAAPKRAGTPPGGFLGSGREPQANLCILAKVVAGFEALCFNPQSGAPRITRNKQKQLHSKSHGVLATPPGAQQMPRDRLRRETFRRPRFANTSPETESDDRMDRTSWKPPFQRKGKKRTESSRLADHASPRKRAKGAAEQLNARVCGLILGAGGKGTNGIWA